MDVWPYACIKQKPEKNSKVHPETWNTHHSIISPVARNTQQRPQPLDCHHQQTEGTSPTANYMG